MTSCERDSYQKLNIALTLRKRSLTYTDRYRSGHNGPDSKSGDGASRPWVRIPPYPPWKKQVERLAFFNVINPLRDLLHFTFCAGRIFHICRKANISLKYPLRCSVEWSRQNCQWYSPKTTRFNNNAQKASAAWQNSKKILLLAEANNDIIHPK